MKYLLIFTILISSAFANDQSTFTQDAKKILMPIKKAFMKEIKVGMKEGPYNAIDSCHIKAPHLIEFDQGDKYEFGRTSHKVRSKINAPKAWLKPILDEYTSSNAKSPKAAKVYQVSGKNVYVEPIYIKSMCLACHGNPKGSVSKRLKKLYPNDQAIGFKNGDFRGLFWIRER